MSEHAETIAKLISELPPLAPADLADIKALLSPAVASVAAKRVKASPTRTPSRRAA
jgi:hypothetical protein